MHRTPAMVHRRAREISTEALVLLAYGPTLRSHKSANARDNPATARVLPVGLRNRTFKSASPGRTVKACVGSVRGVRSPTPWREHPEPRSTVSPKRTPSYHQTSAQHRVVVATEVCEYIEYCSYFETPTGARLAGHACIASRGGRRSLPDCTSASSYVALMGWSHSHPSNQSISLSGHMVDDPRLWLSALSALTVVLFVLSSMRGCLVHRNCRIFRAATTRTDTILPDPAAVICTVVKIWGRHQPERIAPVL